MSGKESIFDQLRSIFGKKTQAPPTVVPQVRPPSPEPAKATQPEPLPRPQSPLQQQLPAEPARPASAHFSPLPGVDLILGIDFGTSCTKVVIGDPGWRAKSYAVPLNEKAEGLARYLRPSRLKWIVPGGKDLIYDNLKMRLMDEPDDEGIRELAALYLASVIRQSLEWFEKNLKHSYATRQLSWSLNLGFPAKAVDTDSPLLGSYQKMARYAAMLGSSGLPLNFQSLGGVVSGQIQFSPPPAIPSNRIQIYPEIAAQLASYVNSPYRVHGNLLLVDVGAGTLDVSTLILHEDNESDICSFHFCEVARFGTVPLLEARVAALNAETPNCAAFNISSVQSGISAAPEQLMGLLRPGHGSTPRLAQAFDSASADFADKMVRVALRCLTQFKVRQRDAHASASFNPWKKETPLRFFLTGGGSRSPFYKKYFIEGHLESELSHFTRWHEDAGQRARNGEGLRLESLPLPRDLEGLPDSLKNDFDRLSVAHGLAYGAENLMRVTASATS